MAIKTHYLDRGRFVRWTEMSGQLNAYILKDSADDLIKGTEHITDLDGLLKYVDTLPGYLFDNEVDDAIIPTANVELTYNKNKDEIKIPKDFS